MNPLAIGNEPKRCTTTSLYEKCLYDFSNMDSDELARILAAMWVRIRDLEGRKEAGTVYAMK